MPSIILFGSKFLDSAKVSSSLKKAILNARYVFANNFTASASDDFIILISTSFFKDAFFNNSANSIPFILWPPTIILLGYKLSNNALPSLKNSGEKIDKILNTNLNQTIENVKAVYSSETATELYATYAKIREKFPEFIKAINSCSTYLSDTVAPAYEKIEATAASKIR